jgi:hypothetical protein
MQRVRSFLLTSFVLPGAAAAAMTMASSAAEAAGPGRAGFGFHRGAGARAFVGQVRSPFFGRRFFVNGRRNAFPFARFANRRFAPWGLAGWGYPGWGYGWGGLWGGYGPYDSGYANAAPAAENAAAQTDMGALVVPVVVGIRNPPEGTPTVYVIETGRDGTPPAAPRNSPPPAGPRGGLSDGPGPKILELGRAANGSAIAADEAPADAGPRIITVKLR